MGDTRIAREKTTLSLSGPSHLEFDSGKRFDSCCPRVSNRGCLRIRNQIANKRIVNGRKLPCYQVILSTLPKSVGGGCKREGYCLVIHWSVFGYSGRCRLLELQLKPRERVPNLVVGSDWVCQKSNISTCLAGGRMKSDSDVVSAVMKPPSKSGLTVLGKSQWLLD